MTTYAVTAATGQLGHLAVEALLERGVAPSDVVAVVRTPSKADDLAARGVVVRAGDYSDRASLDSALAGVDRLLLVSSNEVGQRLTQHTNVVEAAKAAGVQRLAYTSLLRADTSASPLAPEHKATEEVIAASGLPHVLLRNSWYYENYTANLGQYLATGEVLGATHDGRISAASRADYAAAAAVALLADDEGKGTYELAGETFTFTDLAATVTEVTGTTVTSRDVTGEEYQEALTGHGLDAGTAGFVVALDASIANGDLQTDSTDLADLLGRPASSLRDAVTAAHTAHSAS
jgi:NAD(P)H dehydrogenase (quinone)